MPIIVCFEGHLAADPITRTTPAGNNVTDAVVLINPRKNRTPATGTGTATATATEPPSDPTADPATDTGQADTIGHADQGEQGEPTRYVIKAWRHRARALATLTQGDGVVVIGHVETDTWTTRDGQRRWSDTVVVDHLGRTITTPTPPHERRQ